MKKCIITILTSLVMIVANAQTIHWLTFIDTDNSNIGELNNTGREVLYKHFINAVNSSILDYGYKVEIHNIYGRSLSPERCVEEVNNVKCEENDIVIFYYMGYGAHEKTDLNPFPSIVFDTEKTPKYIPLNWVYDKLKDKGAKLTVTICMCSNIIVKSLGEDITLLTTKIPSADKNMEIAQSVMPTSSIRPTDFIPTELTNTKRCSIRNLFLGYKGDIIISSASLCQTSIGCQTSFGAMDLFTATFVTLFDDLANKGSFGWEELLNKTTDFVKETTDGKQTPFWKSTLSPIDTTK